MQNKVIQTLFISVLLLLSLTTIASADSSDYYLVANTTSGADGIFEFDNLPDGNYTLVAVNWSSDKNSWYTGPINVIIEGVDLTDQNIKVNSSAGIDQNVIFSLLNRSSISGITYNTNYDAPAESTLILLDNQTKELIANTSSNSIGHYSFDNIPDGNYDVVAINYSTDKSICYRGIINLNLTGSDLTDKDINVTSSSDIDENYVLGLLNRSSISGMTYLTDHSNPTESTLVLLDNKTKKLIANTSSNPAGQYSFYDISDGDYDIVAINYSTDGSICYRGIINVALTGSDLTDKDINVTSSSDIDENHILGLLNRSSISGITYVMLPTYPRESTVVLLQNKNNTGFVDLPTISNDAEQDDDSENNGSSNTLKTGYVYEYFLNLTTDEFGEFIFDNLPNGEYRIAAVNWSTARGGMWLTNVTDVTVEYAQPVDVGNLSMRSNDEVDQDDILSMLNETNISGKTIGKNLDNKISTVLLTNQLGEHVANTTCNEDGEFLFTGLRNGEYTISAVNWSTARGGMWLTNVTDATVEYAQPVDVGNLSMRSNDEVDQDDILSMLNETNISGKTIGKNLDNKISTVVLTNQFGEFVANTTCDEDGEFLFTGLRNGEYTISAVNWSTARGGMWLTNVTDATVEYAQPVDVGNLSMRSNDEVDQDAILSMLNETSISGKTIGKNLDNKISEVVLMRKRSVAISNEPHLNVSFITGYSSYKTQLANFTQRINSNSTYNIEASYYIADDSTDYLPEDIDFNYTDIIYIEMVTQNAPVFEEQVQLAIDNGAVVIERNSYLPESDYAIPSSFDNDTEEFKDHLHEYWTGTVIDDKNLDNLVFYLAKEYYGREDLTVESAVYVPLAIYHPAIADKVPEYMMLDVGDYFAWYANRTDGHVFDENAPTIAISFYSSYYPDNIDSVDKLIESFEEKGANVIACFGDTSNDIGPYLNYSEETKVDAVVSFNFRGNYFDLEELNVPVLNAVLNPNMNASEWANSSTPLITARMDRIYRPEGYGLIDPIMIGALETIEANTTAYIAVDQQIDWLTDRAIAQANLGLENESDKKVAIIYYNHGGGKDNIGASYLEVMPSIVNLLEGMEAQGYDIDSSAIPNKTELVDLIIHQGRNVGTWAPGELDALVESGEVELIPQSTYLSWFNELPEDMREDVVETWGEAPGEIMVYTDNNGAKFIVIPKISISDNVILAPQPTRGWLQDDEILFHDRDLVPHHQYIAFYLWLQNEFDADVMVNMGRHGTVEWLPGKEFGLMSDEWPALMVGDIPVIYPYVMDGMGEGIQAKRRGNAVIIDHLIPSVISAGLYGDYAKLSNEITLYKTSVAEEDYKQAHFVQIVDLTTELGLDDRVNMSLAGNNATKDDFLEELDDVLSGLKSLSMPYGLHVLGEAPQGEELVGFVNSIMGNDFSELIEAHNTSDNASTDLLTLVLLENMSTTQAQLQILGTSTAEIDEELNSSIKYAELLGETDNEIQQVLNAMNGEYIKGNLGGDPVQKPASLPSGRNFYTFDENLIPSEEAWDNGKELVDEWLTQYYTENGEYPTKVAYILWAGETTRHEGVMEAQILYLMGIKPVWDDKGEVTNVTRINSSELGRPRIDVVVQISGLYRDTFPTKVELLDRAVRLAYEQEETANCPNYVKQNTNALKATYNELLDNETLALDIAQLRIFGPKANAYGTGMSNAVDASDTWENTSELAELYLNNMCYTYGENIWGETISGYIFRLTGLTIDIDNTAIFEDNLNGTQAIFHSRSSSTYGSLDTDDFYQYMGGLYNAIVYVSDESAEPPEMYVVNLQDLNDAEIQTLQTYIENELFARYFNPSWIEGMQLSGFEGALAMEKFMENLWGWEALNPDLISDDIWNKVYDTYIANDELSSWMKDTNAYAYQSMLARATETIRKGNWNADSKTLDDIVSKLVDSVIENGATCCHHTCGNILNQDFASGIAQALVKSGKITQQELDLYLQTMKEATTSKSEPDSSASSSSGNTGTAYEITQSSASNQSSMSDGGAGQDLDKAATELASSDNYVEGYEMTPETSQQSTSNTGTSISGADILASLLVMGGVGVMYLGFMRRR